MPTLTRLALGASAVSALTVLGTALPAAAQTTGPTGPTRSTSHATTHSAASGSTPTRATATRRTTPASRPGRAPSSAERRTTALHAITAGRHAERRATVLRAITAARTSAAAGRGSGSTNKQHLPTTRRLPAVTPAERTYGAGRSTRTRTTTATPRSGTHPRVTGGHTSQNWSGYTQSSRDLGSRISSISASWQVPRASQHVNGRSEAASDWIGIGGGPVAGRNGRPDPTLVQSGTTATIGRAGVANYYSWFETLPAHAVRTPLSTHSGDRMSVSIGRLGSDLWRIRMANASTGRSWSTSVRYASSMNQADWVSERPDVNGTSTPLPSRTATSFRKARVNGSSAHFRPSQRVTMTDGSHAVSTPSGPEAAGDGFSVCSYAPGCGAGSR